MTTPAFHPADVRAFRYVGHRFDTSTARLICRYALDDLEFDETVEFDRVGPAEPAVLAAGARLVYLLAGVSYYKAAAPLRIEADPDGLTRAERALLEAFFLHGLGEFQFVNSLDLAGLEIDAVERLAAPVATAADPARVLVPFGGGIDSIVTVEGIAEAGLDAALFVVSPDGVRFDAIEAPAATTGLDVVRADRRLDPKILRSAELGYLNGHVPVTGVISAIAVMAAVLDGRSAVVMSNERSAESGNAEFAGREVNHQWSKSFAFESLFRDVVAESLGPVEYSSWLRPFSELWVARRFAELGRYHSVFRSCNRAFYADPSRRYDRWCGECDKCCFIDLILSPYVPAAELRSIFGGAEPLSNPARDAQLRTLVGLTEQAKPFECVGEVDECRVALVLAAARDDRSDDRRLRGLAAEVAPLVGDPAAAERRLLQPAGPHHVPTSHAIADHVG